MAKPALGRGLGSLIPQRQTITAEILPEAPAAGTGKEVLDVPIEKIETNPHQPRRHFAASDLEDLISSIKEHGILMPLVVTKKGDAYELIAGERRLRASKMLGLKTAPVVVRDATEQEKLELALIENIQRQQLNALEEALAYRALIDEFNLTQEQAAQRVGKSRSNVANLLRLLDLPTEIQQALRDGKITKSHARTLLAETDKVKQIALFNEMLSGKVTVRDAESKISGKSSKARKVDPNIAAHEKKLREVLGTKVRIDNRGGKGKITIEYYSSDDFMNLLDILLGE